MVKESASEVMVIPHRGWMDNVLVVEFVDEIDDDFLKVFVF